MATSTRKKWDPSDMKRAIEAVQNKTIGYMKAAREFHVPQTTLEDYVRNKKQISCIDKLISQKSGRKPTLSAEFEKQLVQYCIQMDERFYGLTLADVKSLAFQLADLNKIPHPFNVEKRSAGAKWLKLFLQRHPHLAKRKPQGTSMARIKGFNPDNVSKFFDILEAQLDNVDNSPTRIYNVDETGISVVQSKLPKILSLKGKKQVGAITSAERGALITVITCMSASGNYVPPMLIFPRKNMKAELMDGAPPGAISACHPSGWVQQNIFTDWFRHFVKYTRPSKGDQIILILDGHYSHTRNIDVINMARDNGVIIICLPPHSTHKMQPLDLAFMGPFKTYYSKAVTTWLRNNVGRTVTPLQVASLMGQAYQRSATVEVAINGFRKSGIFPCDRFIFRDHDFAAHNVPEPEELQNITLEAELLDSGTHLTQALATVGTVDTPATSSSNDPISCIDIKKLPTVKPNTSKRTGSACLISGSPYKNNLSESLAKQDKKGISKLNLVKGKQRIMKKQTKTENTTKMKRKQKKLDTSDSSSGESNDDSVIFMDTDDDSVTDEEDAACVYCNKAYSSNFRGEKWIKCIACKKWAHVECSGNGNFDFICDICLNG